MTRGTPNGLLLASAGAIVAGITVIVSIATNPPGEIRNYKLDTLRAQNLQRIQTSINSYFHKHHALPTGLSAVDNEEPVPMPHDPTTDAPYEYEISGENSYKLCADYALQSEEGANFGWTLPQWTHGAGHYCHDLKIEDNKPKLLK